MADSLISLLWLSSPALPIGSYAWSQGLSSAIEHGYVQNKNDLESYLRSLLQKSLQYWDLPLINLMYKSICTGDTNELLRLDSMLKSGRETKELLEEEIQQGKSILRLLLNLNLLPEKYKKCRLGYCAGFALSFYLAAGTDCALSEKNIDLLKAYSFCWLQNAVTVACKCIPLGQSEGQEVLFKISGEIPDVCDNAHALELSELGTSAPMLSILSALHEHQYVRIFRS